MAVLINNNAVSRLASSLSAVATTLSVTPGDGAKYPSPADGNWFPATILKASGVYEIVRCTARAGDVLTIARSQEGTAASAFDAGDRVELRITKAAFDELMQQSSFSDFIKTLIDDEDAAAARSTLGLGNAATQTIQANPEDNTADRLMAVGAFGIGAQRTSTETNLNNYNKPGKYVTPASGLTNLPAGWAQGVHVIDVSGGAGFMLQVIADAGAAGKKISYRTAVGTTFTAWTDLSENSKGIYRDGLVLTANKTFAAADAGSYNFVSVTGLTFTLPDPGEITPGNLFVVSVSSAIATCTVAAAAGSIGNVNGGAGGASVALEPGATYEFVAITETAYHMIKTSTPFKRECTSWVNFNGSGTVSVRDSYNVSSITDLGAGAYLVNFSVNMNNANFSVCADCALSSDSTVIGLRNVSAKPESVSSARVITGSSSGASASDFEFVSVQIFGGK